MEKNKFKGTIYQDQYILVVNKPSGLLTVPVGEKGQNDLTSMLNGLKGSDERELIYPCHRLDKETSGVIVFAKGRAVQQNMMDQFRNKEIQKAYIAFVQGKIKQTNGILKNYIQGAWPYKKQGPAKLAITKFRLLYKNNDLSVLEVEPVTGRTNQIRIQFKMIGHPLVGERRFDMAKNWPVRFGRVALHALNIEFIHPVKGNKMVFRAPLSKDMKSFLQARNIGGFDL